MLDAGVREVSEAEISARGGARLAEAAKKRHWRFIRAARTSEGRDSLGRLRSQAVDPGFDGLWERMKQERPDGLKLYEYTNLIRRTLNEALTAAAFSLGVGETGGTIPGGNATSNHLQNTDKSLFQRCGETEVCFRGGFLP